MTAYFQTLAKIVLDSEFDDVRKKYFEFNQDILFERICREKLVIACYNDDIYGKNLPCDLYEIDNHIIDLYSAIELSEHHPFKESINY